MRTEGVKAFTEKAGRFLRKHRPTIIAVAGTVTVVATAVLSADFGIKAYKISQDDISEKREKVKKIAVAAIPPVLTAASGVALFFGMRHDILDARKTAAGLSAAYLMMRERHRALRDAVEQTGGEEALETADAYVRSEDYEIQSRDAEQERDPLRPESSEDRLWYDSISKRYFWATPEKVSDAEYFLNRIFILRGDASLNDFYRLLGLEEMPYGDILGWNIYDGEAFYGYRWVDFVHQEVVDGKGNDIPPYTVIEYPFEPHPCEEEPIEH